MAQRNVSAANFSIADIDRALENPIPPSFIPDLTTFEDKFRKTSPVFEKLLFLKQEFYRSNSEVDAGFEERRRRHAEGHAPPGSYYRKGYERLFQEFEEANGGVFGQGKIQCFLDMGCSPGGFSNWLLENNENACGVGITLPYPQVAKHPLAVDGSHLKESRYHVQYLDITRIVQDKLAQGQAPLIPVGSEGLNGTRPYDLIIAGAFSIGEGNRAWWERIHLVFSQMSIALCNLSPEGDFILVVNTKPFRWLIEVLRLLRLCFRTVSSHKGKELHAIRSSCYIICRGFIAPEADILAYIQSLSNVLAKLGRFVLQPPPNMISSRDIEQSGLPVQLHLFPDLSDDILFQEERTFVLPLLERAWQHQFDVIRTDLVEKGSSTRHTSSAVYRPPQQRTIRSPSAADTSNWRQTERSYPSQPPASGSRGSRYSFGNPGAADGRDSWRQ
ncbi:hypothetical protein ABKN59_005498 [Abortiporus biennis]